MDSPSSPFIPSGFNNNKPVGKSSGFSSRFGNESKTVKQPGFFSALFGTGRTPVKKAETVKSAETKKYSSGDTVKFKQVAPRIAEELKKALPNSFRGSGESQQTMGRIFGAKSGDAWTKMHNLRQMHNAVRQGKWNDPSLERMTDREKKELEYNYQKRQSFLGGIDSVLKK